jgi:hypothetical protein
MALRAVLDTSALVPAAQREDLQSLAQAGFYRGIWSPWIIAELNRVLTWRWIRASRGDLSRANERACSRAAQRMMALLYATFELVHPEPPYPPAWAGADRRVGPAHLGYGQTRRRNPCGLGR